MAESQVSIARGVDENQAAPRFNETVLRSEISFWQEMIDSSGTALPPEAVERMHHAQALAENRLSRLYEEHVHAPANNVFHLDQQRRKRRV